MEGDELRSVLEGDPFTVNHLGEDEHSSKEVVLQKYFVQEWKLVKSLLDGIVSHGCVSDPSVVHKICSIMDRYQEQGQLLEPYLETMISPLMFIVCSKTVQHGANLLEVIKPLCIIIYSLVTVCGYKAVTKFFPHQVSDLELAVFLLGMLHDTESVSSSRQESTGEMEAKCVILLWLSILVLVPFDIFSVDSSIPSSYSLSELEPSPLVLHILRFSEDYLSSAGPMRSIAGLLLSKLLTRPDMSKAFTRFIEWTHSVLSLVTVDYMGHFQLLGVVEALAAIFKSGVKEILLDSVPIIWMNISILIKSSTASQSTLIRKYLLKLIQRIGITCLPHRPALWRYVVKIRSLGENMGSDTCNEIDHDVHAKLSETEQSSDCLEEDMEVPEIVEEIIGFLLSGLRDKDTVVRWSAAKGIGRITFHLTSSHSVDVLSSVLDLFSPGEGDSSWHGGCLALAELARRGLLLPASLPNVVPCVIKALHYDIRRGPHSVGSHVRDASAYVCWAFGRAYSYTEMKSILEQFAPHLLTMACYDREVNCRRAGAAAFQENVGRQGNYPHGIEIVNTADYFALSSRVNSYLHVALCIAQYEKYVHPFISELMYTKICHWEKGLRELAANALAMLVKYDSEYFANFILGEIIPRTLSSDLCTRHGATFAAGEVVLALHHCGSIISIDMQKSIAGVVPAIEKARLYRGKGGELMRAAVSRFIECISISHLPLPLKIKQSIHKALNENLKHPNTQIQGASVNALKHFVPAYLSTGDNEPPNDITSNYLEMLRDPNVAGRRGSGLALGVLPYNFLARRWRAVLSKLCDTCTIEDNPMDRDVETQVNAVTGLISVCETLADEKESDTVCAEDVESFFLFIKNDVMTSLFKALDDYSVDKRGDVGSWVREAAMDSLQRCTFLLCKRSTANTPKYSSICHEVTIKPVLFDANLATALVGGIIKQAVEKMDKLRETAVKILQRILYNEKIYIPYIPHRERLEQLVPNSEDLEWGVASFSYPRFVQLLQFSCYSRYLLSGLVISIGELLDSLRQAAVSALVVYLQDTETNDHNQRSYRESALSGDILWVLKHYQKCDRVIVPTLRTIEILFSKKMLNMEVHGSLFCAGVLESLVIELKGSKNFNKLNTAISILGYIASLSYPINANAFSRLLFFLRHRYPKIRKASAEQVYLVLLQNPDLMARNNSNNIEGAMEIISEICWEGDIEVAKKQSFQLLEMAGLETKLLPKTGICRKNEHGLSHTDENESYSSLVDSSGF